MGALGWAAATALALAIATGCGSDEPRREAGKATEAKQGGSLTFLSAGDVDYLDPGQTYYAFGYMVHYAVNRTLYGYEPGDSIKAVPDLADGEPEISADQRQVTVKLKAGIAYAPPLEREVTSADVKYAIERAFTSAVPSGYARSYFAEIEGAPAKPGRYREISGIRTPDARTIVLRLTEPVAARVVAALVMPITTPVPKEYAQRFDRESPSTYDQHVAQTGPYMVEADAKGRLVGREPGREIRLVRNPNWDRSTDFRPAYLDAITVREGNDDLDVASRRTLSGSGLACCDSTTPPIPALRRAAELGNPVGRVAAGGTTWISLNTTAKPFDNLNVRKAVIAGFDRAALLQARGGKLGGSIAQHWIPPGIPGHEESGGAAGFEEFDWMRDTAGDAELSARYFEAAAAEGVPVEDGRYAGRERLLTIANNAGPGLKVAETAQTEFERLGFRLNFRKVSQETVGTRFCGVPAAHVAICPNTGWFKDFQDPESLLQPPFSGAAIHRVGNINHAQLDVPAINRAMRAAALLPPGPIRTRAWADVNRMIVAQAPGIPMAWVDSVTIASKDVRLVINEYTTSADLAFTSRR